MGKTSSNQKKKIRKLINRTKNRLQRVRKFCRQHVMPVMLATAIIGGVIFGTYLRATATGVEELYYTYWDLVSSIFAAEGYDMSIKNGNDKISTPDRVTGRQLWNNIKQWVKIKCANAKDLYDEFTLLPKAVTAEGIKMSKDLYDLLGDFCAEYSSFSGTCDYGDYSATVEYIHSIMGITGDYKWTGGTTDEYNIWIGLKNGETLNLIQYGSEKCMFTMDASYVDLKLDTTQWGYGVWYSYDGSRYQSSSAAGFTANSSLMQTSSQILDSISVKPTWIIKQGVFYPDVIDKVKDAVDLKTHRIRKLMIMFGIKREMKRVYCHGGTIPICWIGLCVTRQSTMKNFRKVIRIMAMTIRIRTAKAGKIFFPRLFHGCLLL